MLKGTYPDGTPRAITEDDLRSAHRGLKVLQGNYADSRDFVFRMDDFIARVEANGHKIGQIVSIEADRTLVFLRANEEEKWFHISEQDLKALGVGGCMSVDEGGLDEWDRENCEWRQGGSFVFIKDDKISLVW